MQEQIGRETNHRTKQPVSGFREKGGLKIKIGGHYVNQCSHILTTSGTKQGFYPLHVVTMCISQAFFWLLGGRYVNTFIIYHGFSFTNDRRERARGPKTRRKIRGAS